MIRNNRPYTTETDSGDIDDALVTERSDEDLVAIEEWIRNNIRPSKEVLYGHTSYGMKHMLEDDTGIYLTNNAFKDAMWLAGYKPVDPNEVDWHYRIDLTKYVNDNPSPFFNWAKKFENDHTPCGHFVGDMLADFNFPVFAEHDIIAQYLEGTNPCDGAVNAFEKLWKMYQEETA